MVQECDAEGRTSSLFLRKACLRRLDRFQKGNDGGDTARG
jgi:hypothetical protein